MQRKRKAALVDDGMIYRVIARGGVKVTVYEDDIEVRLL